MNSNLKALSVALAAVFALAAVAAPAASAVEQGTLTSDGPVTLIGTGTGTEAIIISAFGSPINCPGSSFIVHKYNETPHKFIPTGATTLTFTPSYKACTSSGTFPTTVTMNGCDFVLHIGKTDPAGNTERTYAVTTDIVCPEGKEMTWSMFFSSTEHTENKPFCVLHIKPQTGLEGAHIRDTGNGTLDFTGKVKGIHVVRTSISHPLFCSASPETTAEGTSSPDYSVTGKNEAGGATAISLSE